MEQRIGDTDLSVLFLVLTGDAIDSSIDFRQFDELQRQQPA